MVKLRFKIRFILWLIPAAFLLALALYVLLSLSGGGVSAVTERDGDGLMLKGGDSAYGTAREFLPGEKININTAPAHELQRLYGIGEAIAEDIIRYRETQGFFQSIEEIMEIDGIGPMVFENIKEYITVGESDENTGSR